MTIYLEDSILTNVTSNPNHLITPSFKINVYSSKFKRAKASSLPFIRATLHMNTKVYRLNIVTYQHLTKRKEIYKDLKEYVIY